MPVTLFAENLLEAASAVTASAPAEATALTRLYDRDRGPRYTPAFAGDWDLWDIAPLSMAMGGPVMAQLDLDIDLGSAQAVTGWGLVNHTVTGVTVTLYGDNNAPATTSRDSFSATAVDVLRTFASLSLRYWRVRIPVMATAPAIGELLLGVPHVLSETPVIRLGAGYHTAGNVQRSRSPGRYLWAIKRGEPLARFPWGWVLSDADLATLRAAFAAVDEGAKKLLLKDEDGTLYWVDWLDEAVAPRPLGNGLWEVQTMMEQAL